MNRRMFFTVIGFLVILNGCSSEWYLLDKVEIGKKDMPVVRQAVHAADWNESHGLTTWSDDRYVLRRIQRSMGYDWTDFWKANAGSVVSGLGLGAVEAHNYGYKWNGLDEDNWFRKWATKNTGGDVWIKFGDFDKAGRTLYMAGDRYGWNKWIRFYEGNWVFALASHWIVQNTIAAGVRNFAKHGSPVWFDIDLFRFFGE